MIRTLAVTAAGACMATGIAGASDAEAWSCRFTLASEASVDLDGWALTTRAIDHPHRIEIDPADDGRARVVAELDALPATVERGEGFLRFEEEAGPEVSAATTIFLVQEIEGAFPAVHTTEQTAGPAFAAITLHGFCLAEG